MTVHTRLWILNGTENSYLIGSVECGILLLLLNRSNSLETFIAIYLTRHIEIANELIGIAQAMFVCRTLCWF